MKLHLPHKGTALPAEWSEVDTPWSIPPGRPTAGRVPRLFHKGTKHTFRNRVSDSLRAADALKALHLHRRPLHASLFWRTTRPRVEHFAPSSRLHCDHHEDEASNPCKGIAARILLEAQWSFYKEIKQRGSTALSRSLSACVTTQEIKS
jgi:hypothetical protein